MPEPRNSPITLPEHVAYDDAYIFMTPDAFDLSKEELIARQIQAAADKYEAEVTPLRNWWMYD